MIRPILEYGDVIYDNIPQNLSNRLENIQRRAALICTGAYRHTEHRILLNELGWDYLIERRRQHQLTLYYGLIEGPCPNHILPHIPQRVSTYTEYNLRNRDNIRTPSVRLQSRIDSFFPKTSREWNALSIETKASLTKASFKKCISSNKIKNPYTRLHHGKTGIWLSRIRMGLSGLNEHRFTYNMIESPICSLCHNGNESTLHYLWHCNTHAHARQNMVDRLKTEAELDQVDNNNIISIVINGKIDKTKHKIVYDIATEFLQTTNRFL
jgi:hypothetical protein